jgi:hypothetical protein
MFTVAGLEELGKGLAGSDKVLKLCTGDGTVADPYVALTAGTAPGYHDISIMNYNRPESATDYAGDHPSETTMYLRVGGDYNTQSVVAYNNNTVYFPDAEEDWGYITAIMLTQNGQEYLTSPLTEPVNVEKYHRIKLPAGSPSSSTGFKITVQFHDADNS